MIKSTTDYSLLFHNTFAIDTRVARFVEYGTVDELKRLIAQGVIAPDSKYIHLGGGSNLLFVRNYPGTVLHSSMQRWQVVDEDETTVRVRVENGTVWDSFCADMAEQGYWGVENLSYIPGEAGAAAVQNIGAYGVEFADVAETVEVLSVATGEAYSLTQAECRYGYRDSLFKHPEGKGLIVLSATLRLSKLPVRKLHYGNLAAQIAPDAGIKEIRQGVIAIRRSKLPEVHELGSAGSFFKNPLVSIEKYEELRSRYPEIPSYPAEDDRKKIPAAWLIEHSGMKGYRVGGAQVYNKQPLVIVNTGGATAVDVITLAAQVSDMVKHEFGIKLEREVIYVE